MSINHIGAIWDSGLYDGPQLLMMLALADFADVDGWCHPNYDTLAKRIRRHVKTVYRFMSQLEGEGAIKRDGNHIIICEPTIVAEVARRFDAQRERNKGRKGTISDPAPKKENPNTEKNGPNTILKNENEILNSGNPILTSENGILDSEKPFYIDPSINHQSNHHNPTTAPPTVLPLPAAVAAADPLSPILTWFGFEDALTAKERTALDVATLLAWAYWVKLAQAEQGSRVRNPVGLVRAQWRKSTAPRVDLLHLARLLGHLEWSVAYGQYDPGEPLDDEFPDIPTAGELGPHSLMPPREAIPPRPAPRNEAPQPQRPPLTSLEPWRDALTSLRGMKTK